MTSTTNKDKKMKYGKTALRLMGYVTSTFKLQFTIVFVTIIISAIAGVAGPLFLLFLIDDFIIPLLSQSNPDYEPLFHAVIFVGIIYYIGVVCTYIYNRLMANIGQGVLKRIRDELFSKMQKLPIEYFDSHSNGELMSLYTNDTDTLRQMISQSIPMAFSATVSVITIFCVMVAISIPLSVVAVIMVFIMSFLTKKIGNRSGKYFIKQQNDIGIVNGYIEEMMSGQKVIKVFCHENAVKEKFDEINEKLCMSNNKANKYANVMMPVMANIGNIQYVITALIGGVILIEGKAGLTIGALVSFLQFTRSFNMPFSQISQQFNSIVMALAGAERIFTAMDEKWEIDEGDITLVKIEREKLDNLNNLNKSDKSKEVFAWKYTESGETKYRELLGDVRFNNMNFGYDNKKMVLKNINLYAKPGQKIAFVGSTGAGKTTITNLINRFYEISQGEILYDGIDIRKIKKDDLRSSLGIVLQDTHLFTGTIKENIRYGKLDATDEEIFAAAKLANAEGFIQMLPNGYNTIITGEGEGLSQGQCQLLSIARAAVANPPVLILDEATSSIDTRTEALVQQGMDALMNGRTVFVIAHRLSTIRNSDVIMVLENGEIIERGNHEQLIGEKGKYYQLYTGKIELS